MSTVKWSEIGTLNKQLILDLKAKRTSSGGYPIDQAPPAGWLHGGFEYDIRNYGVYNYQTKVKLPKDWYGVKYYCFNNAGIDMKKRIVMIFEKTGTNERNTDTAHYFRLIHTGGKPGAYNNDYASIDEIIEIGD